MPLTERERDSYRRRNPVRARSVPAAHALLLDDPELEVVVARPSPQARLALRLREVVAGLYWRYLAWRSRRRINRARRLP